MKNAIEGIKQIIEIFSPFDFLESQTQKLERLAKKLAEGDFILPIIGEFKSGKSSIINSIIGKELLETSPLEATSCIYEISFSNDSNYFITLDYDNNENILHDLNELNRLNQNDLFLVKVYLSNPLFPKGFTIVDTPGLSSLNQKLSEKCTAYFPLADKVAFAVDINQGISKSIINHVNAILSCNKNIILLLTKTDTKPESEVLKAKQYIETNFAGKFQEVILCSAKKDVHSLTLKLTAIADLKAELLETSANEEIKLVGANAVKLIDFTLSNANLVIAELDAKIDAEKADFEMIKIDVERIIRNVETELSKIESDAVKIFRQDISETSGYLTKASFENPNDLEEIFTNMILKIFNRVIENDVDKKTKNVVRSANTQLHDLVKKVLSDSLSIDFDILTENKGTFQTPILSFVGGFLENIGNGLLRASMESIDDEDISAVLAILGHLSILIGKGTQIATKNYVKSQIELSLEKIKTSFKSDLRKAFKGFKQQLKNDIDRQLSDLESSLLSSLFSIKQQKQDKRDKFQKWLESLSDAKNKIFELTSAQ